MKYERTCAAIPVLVLALMEANFLSYFLNSRFQVSCLSAGRSGDLVYMLIVCVW